MGTNVFVMTDVVGSTSLWEMHGEEMRRALELHDEVVHGAMERTGGRVFKHTGDGMIAAFADADAAAAAALDAVEGLAVSEWGATGPLSIRTALHAGQATERRGDFFGPPVNKVARINGVGHAGQVVASDVARQLMAFPGGVDLGVHQLKDLSEPVRLWQLDEGRHPALASMVGSRHNLPRQLSEFVGRSDEIDELRALVDEHRLVTVTGVGGCGKTRLALEVATSLSGRFPGGLWLVDLTPERDEARIGPVLIEALALPGLGEHDDVISAIGEAIGDSPTLLLFDNCEHLIDGVAEFVEDLLARLPDVHALATSRESLSVPGERSWRIPNLGAASVELFLDRGAAAGATGLDDDIELIESICAALDHIPLAIELAAAQTSFIPPAELASRLDDRFALLGGGRRARRQRQQTLQAMMDWSYELLDADEQRLLCELSVFASPFSLDGAAAVWSGTGPVLEPLRSLVQQSLVVPMPGSTHFRLLETVRLYGLDKLGAEGRIAETRDRHLAWVQSFCDWTAIEDLSWAGYVALHRRQLAEADSYVEALEWLDAKGDDDALRSLFFGGFILLLFPRPQQGLQLLERFEIPRDDGDALRWLHLYAESFLRWFMGDRGAADPARLCVEEFRRRLDSGVDVPDLLLAVVYLYGVVQMTFGDLDGALEMDRLLTDLADSSPGLREEALVWRAFLTIDGSLRIGDRRVAGETVELIIANFDALPPELVAVASLYAARHEMVSGNFDAVLESIEHIERGLLSQDMQAQLPEIKAGALIRSGRTTEGLAVLRDDAGPQFLHHRRYLRDGRIMDLIELFHLLGDTDAVSRWARASRDLAMEEISPFRAGRLAELAGGDEALVALPPSDLVGVPLDEVEALVDAALDDVERRLSELSTA
jgi:predicted ATPase